MRITVGKLKGGTGKTTSSVFLALGLARTGRVLLVDADPQGAAGSASGWRRLAGEDWPDGVTVIPWADASLARNVRQVERDYDHLVIDTGPEDTVVLRQALMVTDHLLVPVGTSPIEIDRVPLMARVATEVDAVSPTYTSVLLCKVRARSLAHREARDLLASYGMAEHTLAAVTHDWDTYRLAYGSVPADLAEYDQVLAELDVVEVERQAEALLIGGAR